MRIADVCPVLMHPYGTEPGGGRQRMLRRSGSRCRDHRRRRDLCRHMPEVAAQTAEMFKLAGGRAGRGTPEGVSRKGYLPFRRMALTVMSLSAIENFRKLGVQI